MKTFVEYITETNLVDTAKSHGFTVHDDSDSDIAAMRHPNGHQLHIYPKTKTVHLRKRNDQNKTKVNANHLGLVLKGL